MNHPVRRRQCRQCTQWFVQTSKTKPASSCLICIDRDYTMEDLGDGLVTSGPVDGNIATPARRFSRGIDRFRSKAPEKR